jgi:hypothetical protein
MKEFKLKPDQIRHVAHGYGSCLATDRITVDGSVVGYCYREEPESELDSGWRFFAGDEDEGYLANAANLEVYDVNTIANYDPDVAPLLDSNVGCAYERSQTGFVMVAE